MTTPRLSPDNERLLLLAERLIWWKAPREALADENRLLAQVMTFGTWNDIQEARQFWPEAKFRAVLESAPPGVFDARSWSYWHHVLERLPVPTLPTRKLPDS